MPVVQSNAIAGLQEFQWRGLSAPCSEVTFDFTHTHAPLVYPYVDDEGHDNTGRAAYRIQATLHFLNTVEPDLYPTRWRDWLPALLDGSPDDLIHPDVGAIRARVLTGSFTVAARERAGIVVRATWTSTWARCRGSRRKRGTSG